MGRTAVLFLVILSGCHATSTRLWGPGPITPEAEALAGTRAAPALEARWGGVIRNADAERRMEHVGQRLCQFTPGIQARYKYRLLGTDRVNAFSLPGGRIYVTQGLYARLTTDELLAAVLAHETAHIASKDHFKPRCSTSGEALDREIAADAGAVVYLRAADIPPEAMIGAIRIIEDVQPQGWADIRAESVTQSLGNGDVIARYAEARP